MRTPMGKLLLAACVLGLAASASAKTWSNITTYPVPTDESYPFWIATGLDGALWFTEYAGNKIGRNQSVREPGQSQGRRTRSAVVDRAHVESG